MLHSALAEKPHWETDEVVYGLHKAPTRQPCRATSRPPTFPHLRPSRLEVEPLLQAAAAVGAGLLSALVGGPRQQEAVAAAAPGTALQALECSQSALRISWCVAAGAWCSAHGQVNLDQAPLPSLPRLFSFFAFTVLFQVGRQAELQLSLLYTHAKVARISLRARLYTA